MNKRDTIAFFIRLSDVLSLLLNRSSINNLKNLVRLLWYCWTKTLFLISLSFSPFLLNVIFEQKVGVTFKIFVKGTILLKVFWISIIRSRLLEASIFRISPWSQPFRTKNKTLCERIFGRCCTTGMILWKCLIAAKELSSCLTREDKSFTPLVCWTTQLIQYVPVHNKNSVISRQCLKICTSSMQTCLEPNCNIGHKWLQPGE